MSTANNIRPPSQDTLKRLKRAFDDTRDIDGPLSARLGAYAAAAHEIFPVYATAVDHLVARLYENNGAIHAPGVGEQMPPFVLPDETGRLIGLDALLADGCVAVIFYRGSWCPYCRLSFQALVSVQDRIRSLGGSVVAVMPELQAFTGQLKHNEGASFPILTDLDNGYAMLLNLAIWLSSDIQELLSYVDLPSRQGNDGWLLPVPATFIVDRHGVIRSRFIDPDFRKRMEIDHLLSEIGKLS